MNTFKRLLSDIPSTVKSYFKKQIDSTLLTPTVLNRALSDIDGEIEKLQYEIDQNQEFRKAMTGHTLQLTSSAILMNQGLLNRANKCKQALLHLQQLNTRECLENPNTKDYINELSCYWEGDHFEFDFTPPYHML